MSAKLKPRAWVVTVILIVMWLTGCQDKYDISGKLPKVNTLDVSSIKLSTAIGGGIIVSIGGGEITDCGVCYSTSPVPQITDNHTSELSAKDTFSSFLTGLKPSTQYFARAYAINSYGVNYGEIINFTTQPEPDLTVTDFDGNSYHTIIIGSQTWMSENLKTTHYKDGKAITGITDNAEWAKTEIPAYCWYNNDAVTMSKTYGALYNKYAVSTDICPIGWHIPTHAEWDTLIGFLKTDSTTAGAKLKQAGYELWNKPNIGATNESEFNALPGGCRHYDGSFYGAKNYGFFWTQSNYIYISYSNSGAYTYTPKKNTGYSVRCIKD